MNEQNIAKVSVIDPVGKAVDRVKEVLFNPFDIGRWFIIGFCAWLARFGQGGGSGGGFNPAGAGEGPSPAQVKAWFIEHLPMIISIGLGIFLLVMVFGIIFLWLSSRGRFMFLHCVALNKAEVKAPWHKFRNEGNSLFVFRLVLGIAGFICIAVPGGALVLLAIMLAGSSVCATPALFVGITTLVLTAIIIGILFALTGKFTKDFVVPIMYLRRCRCLDGWGEFWHLLGSNKARFTLYILFQMLISMAIGAIIMALACATCCCAACIFAIPYIGTVALLPIFVFVRSYSLYYLAQYGGQYDVFIPIAQLQEPPAAESVGEEPTAEPPETVE